MHYPSFNGVLGLEAGNPHIHPATFVCYGDMFQAALQLQTPESLAAAEAIYHEVNQLDLNGHFFSLN
jgi:hypothetical protein